MAFAAPRSFSKRARSLAAGLGVRRPLHVRGLVVDRCTCHTLTSPELTKPARAAGEKENGVCGRYPPAMPLVFKGLRTRPDERKSADGWLGQMVS